MANPNDIIGKSFQRGPGAEFLGARGNLETEEYIENSAVDTAGVDEPTEGLEAGTSGRRFAGVGPSRYRSTGDATSDLIVRHFTDHDALDATDIEVDVEDDKVTLRGNVRTKECKQLAEDLAKSVAGVNDVSNKLRVHAFDEVTHKYV